MKFKSLLFSSMLCASTIAIVASTVTIIKNSNDIACTKTNISKSLELSRHSNLMDKTTLEDCNNYYSNESNPL